MHLGYGQIQQLVMDMHAIPSSRSTAVSSRIRYMNRMDFPRGLRVGKGGRSTYDIEQALAMAIAFELLQYELSPIRTVRTVRSGWLAARGALAGAWADLRDGSPSAGGRTMIATVQNALDDLAAASPPSPDEPIADALFALTPEALGQWCAGSPPGRRRLLLIDPHRVIETMRGSLPAGMQDGPFTAAMDALQGGGREDVV